MQISVFNLISKFEYESNQGDTDIIESQCFINIEDAENALADILEETEPTTEHGKFMILEIRQSAIDVNDDVNACDIIALSKKHFSINSGDQIKSITIDSAPIPDGSVIVEYNHSTFMDYAYNIKSVRFPEIGDTYLSLHVQHNKIRTSWDKVYASAHELYNAYMLGDGIFGKINKGESIIHDFLDDTDYPIV